MRLRSAVSAVRRAVRTANHQNHNNSIRITGLHRTIIAPALTPQRLAVRAMSAEASSLRPFLSIQSEAEPWMPRGWLEGADEDEDGT